MGRCDSCSVTGALDPKEKKIPLNMSNPSFNLPQIHDNEDGAWGPSQRHLPAQFKDIPYAPYSKSDKLGRFADWNDLEGAARTALPAAGSGNARGATKRGREQAAFGSGTASAFAYFHVEDEASFSLVDNKATAPRRGGATGFGRGRGARTLTATANKPGQRSARTGYGQTNRGTGVMRGGRRGWRDWEKVCIRLELNCRLSNYGFQTSRDRESSVAIDPSWRMLEEIDFVRLAKLRLDVDEPEDV